MRMIVTKQCDPPSHISILFRYPRVTPEEVEKELRKIGMEVLRVEGGRPTLGHVENEEPERIAPGLSMKKSHLEVNKLIQVYFCGEPDAWIERTREGIEDSLGVEILKINEEAGDE